MAVNTSGQLRADAARNAERILRAAREVYADRGPDASLEEIARHAGVGNRTLYRRFPTKGELARAALDQSIAEDIAPAIQQAINDDDPLRGLATVLEAAMTVAAREHNLLMAARSAGRLTAEVYTPFYETLTLLTRRAQQQGQVRTDLEPDDLPRIVIMLVSVLWTMDPHTGGWRRYLALLLDALSPNANAPLPAAIPPLQVPNPTANPPTTDREHQRRR